MISELTELEQSTTDATIERAPPRVLITEEQANERELLATCPRLGGIDVATAGNGREAFDRHECGEADSRPSWLLISALPLHRDDRFKGVRNL